MKTFEQKFPLERPHCGIPMANGNFGALVWGVNTLNVTVNQNDLWDHRGGELVDERDSYAELTKYAQEHHFAHSLDQQFHRTQQFIGRPRRLAAGRFDFVFPDGVKPVSAELIYAEGKLNVTLNNGTALSLVLVLKQNILYLDDPAGAIIGVELHPASDFPKVRAFNAERGVAPYELLSDGWTIHLPEDPDFTVRTVKCDTGWKVFSNADNENIGETVVKHDETTRV